MKDSLADLQDLDPWTPSLSLPLLHLLAQFAPVHCSRALPVEAGRPLPLEPFWALHLIDSYRFRKLMTSTVSRSVALILVITLISCGGGAGSSGNATPIAPPTPDVTLGFSHIFTYGQSLSTGVAAFPVISTLQPYNNLMFAEGARVRGISDGFSLDALHPLVESRVGSFGETPTAGTANYIVELIEHENNILSQNQKFAYIGSAPGQASLSISSLNRGTARWTGLMDQVTAAMTLSKKENMTYEVAAMSWSQGEADYIFGTSRANYKALLLQMHHDFATDVSAITNQTTKPVLVSYQLAAHRKTGLDSPDIALAIKDAADANPNIYLSNPMYHLEYAEDNVHLTADGSLMLGKYYGRALKSVLHDNIPWLPLQPTDVTWAGQLIEVTLHVPYGPLVIDDSVVAEAPNYGFDIWDENNGAVLDIIESVTIQADDKIQIQLSSVPQSKVRLTYARGRIGDSNVTNNREGPRGNIRDSHGDTHQYIGSDGRLRRLDNYLVIFEAEKP